MPASELVYDRRDIETLHELFEDGNYWRIGYQGIERIEAYEEVGQMLPVPWFRVWVDGVVKHRIPAHAIGGITYKTPPPPK